MTCLKCLKEVNYGILAKIYIEDKLEKLKYMAEKRNMSTLRDVLFDTMERVRNGDMDIGKARTICDLAQAVINSAKVEVEYIKSIGCENRTPFIETHLIEKE